MQTAFKRNKTDIPGPGTVKQAEKKLKFNLKTVTVKKFDYKNQGPKILSNRNYAYDDS